MRLHQEKRIFQLAVCVACCVPIGAGLAGIFAGPSLLDQSGATIDLSSHMRYLSGLLLGIGLAFLMSVPRCEIHTARFSLLTFIVVVGGLGRAYGMLADGLPHPPMIAALAMELAVTPALYLWQRRLNRRLFR